MTAPIRVSGRTPSLSITCRLAYPVGLDLEAAAKALGLSRHRLFLLAFETGFPIVTAQLRAEQSATAITQPPAAGGQLPLFSPKGGQS